MIDLLADLDEVVPGELDNTAPAVIWLQIDTTGDNNDRSEPRPGADGVTWQNESIGGQEIQYVRADLYRDMAKRLEAAERDATVWLCTRSYPTGDGGRYYSEEFAKTKADMLIYKAKGYHCEILSDDAMQETGR